MPEKENDLAFSNDPKMKYTIAYLFVFTYIVMSGINGMVIGWVMEFVILLPRSHDDGGYPNHCHDEKLWKVEGK